MNEEPFRLTRRKALAGFGTIGVAGAGAGLGTSAYFSDEETFQDNSITAGQLDLVVDYFTSVDQGSATGDTGSIISPSGEVNGDGNYQYVINDVKPGDSGTLAFCPKLVDNPGYLWVGSAGVTDFENGSPEPELSADTSNGDPGNGEGELSESIQVDVIYASGVSLAGDGSVDYTTERELNNPDDYTLADLAADLEFGFQIDGDFDGSNGVNVYPGSSDGDTQAGPCVVVEWEVPSDVGNEIQTDSIEMDFEFATVQERHNPTPANPFATGTGFSSISFEKALGMQMLAEGGSGRGEIQIHSDSGGVENDTVFGTDLADDYPADTDVSFTAEIDPVAGTASLTVNGVTVTDNDVTDGTANGSSTGDPEWPGGVPSTVDVAINAHSGGGVTTVVEDVEVNGTPASPDTINEGAAGGNTFLAISNADATSTLSVTGTVRFEGSQSDYTSQDWVGVDFR